MTTQVNEISIIPGIPLGFYDVNGNKQFDPELETFHSKKKELTIDESKFFLFQLGLGGVENSKPITPDQIQSHLVATLQKRAQQFLTDTITEGKPFGVVFQDDIPLPVTVEFRDNIPLGADILIEPNQNALRLHEFVKAHWVYFVAKFISAGCPSQRAKEMGKDCWPSATRLAKMHYVMGLPWPLEMVPIIFETEPNLAGDQVTLDLFGFEGKKGCGNATEFTKVSSKAKPEVIHFKGTNPLDPLDYEALCKAAKTIPPASYGGCGCNF